MAEFQTVIKAFNRMCKTNHGNCFSCPMMTDYFPECKENLVTHAEKIEPIIEKWRQENPVYPTFGNWLRSLGFTMYGLQTRISPEIAKKLNILPSEE